MPNELSSTRTNVFTCVPVYSNRLEVTLYKEAPGAWSALVVGDTQGQVVLDDEQRQRVHEQLAHLTSSTLVNNAQSSYVFSFYPCT